LFDYFDYLALQRKNKIEKLILRIYNTTSNISNYFLKMFTKSFSFIVILFFSSINLIVFACPFLLFGGLLIGGLNNFLPAIKTIFAIFLLMFFSLLNLYFIFDYLFGLSLKKVLKNCHNYKKIKDYDFFTTILQQTIEKFNQPNLQLFISNAKEPNIYSFASISQKTIIINKGLIEKYILSCQDAKMFLTVLRSLLAKEASFLANRDFFVLMLVYANKSFIKKITYIYKFLLILLTKILYVIFRKSAKIIDLGFICYNILLKISIFFQQTIMFIYSFLQYFCLQFNKNRCYKQASLAFGGNNMVLALSFLPKNSGIFSNSYNNVAKSMKKLNNIKSNDENIIVSATTHLGHLLTFCIVAIIFVQLFYLADLNILLHDFIIQHQDLYHKLSVLWQLLKKIY